MEWPLTVLIGFNPEAGDRLDLTTHHLPQATAIEALQGPFYDFVFILHVKELMRLPAKHLCYSTGLKSTMPIQPSKTDENTI
jgi:hypothetical protein